MLVFLRRLPDPFHLTLPAGTRRLHFGWLLALTVCVAACSTPARIAQQLPTETAAQTAQPPEKAQTETPAPNATPAILPTPTSSSAEPETSCPARIGRVEKSILRDPQLFRDMPFRVYLPPCYGEDPNQSYPTLYLLHGLQSTDAQWDESGVDETADALISSGTLPPFIIVMPWHRTGIDLTQAIPEILLPHIEQNYAARPDRAYRAIGGVSKGGGQALEIGLKYPHLFEAVGMHSPAVQYLDAVIVEWALNIPPDERPTLWIDIGLRDSLYPAAESLIDKLQGNSIPITIQINEGDHLAEYWQAHLEGYLRWYASNWQRESLKNTIE